MALVPSFWLHHLQGPFIHCTVRPQLHHASVRSSRCFLFHTEKDVKHLRAVSVLVEFALTEKRSFVLLNILY